MPTREEVTLAAQLVHRGLVARSDAESCLRALDPGGGMEFDHLLVARGLVSADALQALRLELAVAGGSIPDLFPGYLLLDRLGEGGTSWVFRARRAATGGDVAVKILRPAAARVPRSRAQFLREARLLKSLRHPNLVEGYEVGRIRGFYFLSMEAVAGESLLWHIDRKMLFDEDAALYVVLQIARVLEYLRENGIVHRDIKPGNVLLTADNTVKLCDLGLAAVRGEEAQDGDENVTVGTVEYVSPEQARGGRDLDVRSDIYSLGASLYHLVLGRLPFEGTDNQEVMARQILESLSSPEVKSRVSPHMHYFIEKMMAKDREIRYQDPVQLIHDIESQIEGKRTLTYNPRTAGTSPVFPGSRSPSDRSASRRSPGSSPAHPGRGPQDRRAVRNRRRQT